MQEDFFYEFPGFCGIRSKCHIRIVAESGRPVVIVCSQTPDNHGTSVQNAYEIIRDQVYQYLSNKSVEKKRKFLADTLDEFATTIEKAKKLTVAVVVFLLRQVSGALKNEKSILDLLRQEKPDVVWLEHWPAGTGLSPDKVDYLLVSENETGSPHWDRIDVSTLATKLGYSVDQISIPASTFA
ncbi:hypothetical protein [Pseudogulbenkiania sp. NH8B]|uniref:hypothetical protein n=1 Tax=Pseudogulbenkiania sp. (strain NH8B) TaxID=748280 RepID=UPI0011D23C51|nr:hypothetical protein [Pseudogulbenkiania sp. NH8B]